MRKEMAKNIIKGVIENLSSISQDIDKVNTELTKHKLVDVVASLKSIAKNLE